VAALSVTNTLALAGTINGGGSLTSNGIFNWTAGTLSGGNTLTVPFGTTLNITGASGKLMDSGVHLVVAGTANWTGGTITLNNSSLLDIQPGGIFDAQSDNTIANSFYNGTVSNSGTFRKTAGAGSTTINSGVPFVNSGRLTVTSGKINAQSLTLNTGSILGPGFTIGTGTTSIAGPSVVESGAAVTFSGGTLTGSSSLTVNGTLDWSGGAMSGGASVIVPLGKSMTISGAAQKTMDSGFALSIAGTVTWTDGKIVLNNSSLLDIQAGGVFDAQSDDTIANTYYSGSIANAGTFRKTAGVAATTVSSGVPFNNSGRIEITAGSTDFQTLTLNAGSVIAGTKFTIVSGGTTIAGASSVEAGALMTLSGGTLQGSSVLTVNGTFQFAGGSMEGAATVTVPVGGVLNFTGASSKTLGSAFDLNIAGNATWSAGTIVLNNSATLDVLAGGLFDIQSNGAVINNYYSGALSNNGTLRKSAGGGATSVSSGVPFTNGGRLEMLSGTFAAATATLAAGTVIAGTGFTISTGTTNVTGTSTVETGASMTLASGGVLGGSVPLTVDGALQWTGGTMSGSSASANIASAGILNISGAAAKTIESGFDLNVSGTAHWSGGTIYVNNSSLLNVTAGGLFLVEHDGSITNNYYNGTISNNGIFRKNAGGGAATVSSGVPFANSGRIDITSGTFNANALTLNAGSILSGTGFTIAAGATTVSGPSAVEAGSAMTMSGGTLTGTSTLTIDGTLDWNGGVMSDGASVTVPAGKTMTISGPAQKILQSGFTLNIAGAAHWTGGSIAVNNSSLLNIQSGGVFDAQTDGTISNTYYNGSIVNSGTFRKSAGAGAATISGVPFSNSGRFEILSGTMAATPLTLNAGTVIAGTGFRINSGTTTLAGASSVELGSSMTMAGGTLNGASTLTVNGTMNWIGGNMDSTGTVTIPAGSLMVLSGTGNKILYSGFNLLNAGTMQWTGGNIHVNNSSLLHNQATGLFLVETDADITNSYYNGTFTNSGILRKINSTATTAVSSGVPFTNTGTLDIRSGALQLTNPSLAGTTILNFGIAGTTPLTGYGRLVVASPVALAGTISVTVIGPFVPQGGDPYSVITYSSRSGTLAESLSFGSGRAFTTAYNATNLTLTASGPTITSPLSPNTDTTVGGATVTINGSGFVSTPTVTFGGTPSALVTFVNSSQLTAVAPAHAPGAVDVVVTNPDGQPTTAYSAFTYTANGDLSLTKTASPTRVATGGAVTYTLAVSNSGPSSSTSVTVTDTLPSGMTLASVSSGAGWSCSNNGATPPTITCTMATLAAGNAAPIAISV
ncbi:MAG TPA: IPT/TIG domain-containing protein, partial [Thermoanaerobaculia bacterium]